MVEVASGVFVGMVIESSVVWWCVGVAKNSNQSSINQHGDVGVQNILTIYILTFVQRRLLKQVTVRQVSVNST